MRDNDDGHDEAVLAEIRELYERVDPVPPELAAAVRDSLRWRTPGARLAELTHDSACEPTENGAVRGTEAGRLLAFEDADLSIIVEVREFGGRRRILGQVVGCPATTVRVRHPAGVHDAPADALGRFRADDLPPGPVSFVCGERETAFVTDWVVI